jgi:ribosomal protein S18 acetylase RimI-like enzyme
VVKQFRRLEVPSKGDLYDRAQGSLLRSFWLSREECERLERERPELIVSEERGILVGGPEGRRLRLHYAFPHRDDVRQLFPEMLDRLLRQVDKDSAPGGLVIRFTDHPNRPYVEPVLLGCAFELWREWMEMVLADLPDEPPPPDELLEGVVLRPIAAADYDEVAILDKAAFGDRDHLAEHGGVARMVEDAAQFRVAEQRPDGRLAGYLKLLLGPERTGEVPHVVVHPEFQRRGLGEAMMRWAAAWFRERGLRRVTLKLLTDNAPAIALYRKLGYVPTTTGLTYRRPVDEAEVRKILEKQRGTYIKFGQWR